MCRIACIFVLSLFAVAPAAVSQNQSAEEVFPKSGGAARISSAQVFGAYGKLPLSFEANGGQSSPEVKFLTRGLGYALFLTRDGAVLSLQRPNQEDARKRPFSGAGLLLPEAKELLQETEKPRSATASVLYMQVLGANPATKIVGADELPGKSNYFIGNDPKKWRPNLSTFAKVKYRDIYPGVDLVYYGNQGRLEYDFVIAPGAEPEKIRLEVAGKGQATENDKEQNFLRIDTNGDLVVSTDGGEVRYQRPVAYQQAKDASSNSVSDESKQFVEARYVLKSKSQVGFEVPTYDDTQPLIIDPVLVYSTFVAGNFYDQATAITVDSSGNAYITGETYSSVPNFPVTPGAYQTTCGTDAVCNFNLANGGTTNTDVFVTKLSADGSALVYSTYIGGSYDDQGNGIAVDSSGNAYVTGYTRSPDFPTTTGAFQKVCGPATLINYSCQAIVQSTCGGARPIDGFVTKLNGTGSALVYSTFLGGVGNDYLAAIAVNPAGEAYVVGTTDSNANTAYSANSICPALGITTDYPTTPGGFMAAPPLVSATQPPWPGFGPAVVLSKLSADGSSLLYSTYFGANAPYLHQNGNGIAIDASGNAYITGSTNSPSFPITAGAFQTVLNQGGGTPGGACGGANCLDAFVAKFDPTKSGPASLVYSTFLGGAGEDAAGAIAVDSSGDAFVTGATGFNGAPTLNFPTTSGAFQSACPSLPTCTNTNAFVTKLNPAGTGLAYSSYLGGGINGSSQGNAIALDSSGRAYITGTTNSYNFPEKNPTQGFIPSVNYAFISIFKADGSDLDFSTYLGGNGYTFGDGIAVDSSDDMYVTGYTLAKDFPTTAGAFQTNCGNCGNSGYNRAPFVTKISPAIVPTTTTITSAPAVTYPANGVVTVTVSATSGIPTGNVTLTVDGGSPLSQVLDGTGTASFTITSPSVGNHSLSASYAAQGGFAASGPVTATLVVNGTIPTTTAISAPAVTYPGSGVVTVTVSSISGTPTGSVSLSVDGGSPIFQALNGSGMATFTVSGLSGGNHSLLATYAAQGSFGSSSAGGSLSVGAASLTVTAANAVKVYGAPLPAFSVTYNGFVNGDNAASLGGALAFSTTATQASPVGSYAIMPSGLTSSNYAITFVNGTLSITPATLTVTAANAAKVYGAPLPGFSVTYNGFVNGDNVASLGGALAFSTTATQASPVGSYAIMPSGLTSSNYAITFVNGTLSITPATLTIMANNAARPFGANNPTVMPTITGLLNGDPITATDSISATTASPVGNYPIVPTVTGAANVLSNYNISLVNGTLTVVPETTSLTINFSPLSIMVGQSTTATITLTGPDMAIPIPTTDLNNQSVLPPITLTSPMASDILSNNGVCTPVPSATPGVASCMITVTSVEPNGRTLVASFPGSPDLLASSSSSNNTGNLIVTAALQSQQVCIASDFRNVAVPGGSYVWFNSIFKVRDVTKQLIHVSLFKSSVQFQYIDHAGHTVTVNQTLPDAKITIDPNATSASTTFDTLNNAWVTTIPWDLDDNSFLTGLPWRVPAAGLPADVEPVTVCGTFASDVANIDIGWRWAAAAYSTLGTNATLAVKPMDTNSDNPGTNHDLAGTPENYKQYVIPGARGKGGKNYTGSYSRSAVIE